MSNLIQTQSQSQAIAPILQQSLQILQAPMLELRNLIREELCSNPTLEEDIQEPTIEDKKQEHDEFQEEFDRLAKLDDEWRDYMTQSQSYSGRSAEDEEKRQFFFDSLVSNQTLQQHLMEQLNSSGLAPIDRQLAELIIGNIDDAGFLQVDPLEIASNTGMEAEDLFRVLELVQTFHPVGVGARDLRECLLIQLRRSGKEQSLEYRIIDRHIEDLGKRRFPEIARRLGTTTEQVQRAAGMIATLDPKPGHIFSADPNSYVLPDVNVEKIGGTWTISLHGEQIPHLRISNTYKDLMSESKNSDDSKTDAKSGSEVKDYIRDKIRSGKFLIESIQKRQQTISNIAREIVAKQKDFLETGPSALKPLTMVQIADIVGVHETTVSRAISGKYIATPWGVFDLKYFFTPGYQTAGGEAMSNTSVKGTIAEMVKTEDDSSPLSDKEIVELLEKHGIPIARRTVAKYRNELNILPSNMRKRY